MDMTRTIINMKVIVIAAMSLLITSTVRADTWRGTAPFCRGRCLPGETQIEASKFGTGGRCLTGQKVLCRNTAPVCIAQETKVLWCVGVIEFCEVGYYEVGYGWKGCG